MGEAPKTPATDAVLDGISQEPTKPRRNEPTLVRLSAPRRIVAPLGVDLWIPYEAQGAAEIFIDPLDPFEAPWCAPAKGVLYCQTSTETQVFRFCIWGIDGDRFWASTLVEAWTNSWLSIDGDDFPEFHLGRPELPKARFREVGAHLVDSRTDMRPTASSSWSWSRPTPLQVLEGRAP